MSIGEIDNYLREKMQAEAVKDLKQHAKTPQTLNLKPCPGCGNTDIQSYEESDFHGQVCCHKCGWNVQQKSKDEAEYLWNTRVSPSEISVSDERQIRDKVIGALQEWSKGCYSLHTAAGDLFEDLLPYLREPKRESTIEKALANAAEILANFKGEPDNTKMEEWQACYAKLFTQMAELAAMKRESGEADKILKLFLKADTAFNHGDDTSHSSKFAAATERMYKYLGVNIYEIEVQEVK